MSLLFLGFLAAPPLGGAVYFDNIPSGCCDIQNRLVDFKNWPFSEQALCCTALENECIRSVVDCISASVRAAVREYICQK